MLKIRHINPGDPGIIKIAKRFNRVNEGLSLLNVLKIACDGDDHAQRFILEEMTLTERASRRIMNSDSLLPDYINYVFAVGLAQRRIKRAGDEYAILARLVEKNFPISRKKIVLDAIWKTADSLYETDEASGTNFLHYLIDKFTDLSLEKKSKYKDGLIRDNGVMDIGDIDTELSSGENGFILTAFEAEDIIDLLVEAAITPWDINKKI